MSSMHALTAGLMAPKLGDLASWIEAARGYAEERGFDADVLVSARLSPDQYPFVGQVQSACDTAKFAVTRLTGREAPSHPDTETTLDELLARIENVRSWLGETSDGDYDGAADRQVRLPGMKDTWLTSSDYVHQFAIPNFFFHLTHAYAILRHNGVPLGKRAYLGRLTLQRDEVG